MKITVYTTSSCEFSKKEKEYLSGKTLQYEEKNLDSNKEFLNEMMTVGNNFAGTPVTKIEKDDGTIVVLKGFTKEEFDTALGFSQPEQAVPQNPQEQSVTSETPAAKDNQVSKPADQTQLDQVEAQNPQTVQNQPLNNVLDKLETNISQPQTPAAPVALNQTPEVTQPVENTPSVPDFPKETAQSANT